MTLFWSGPGRALQTHLALFHLVDRARTFRDNNEGRAVDTDDMPATLRQRLKLMTTMGGLGPQIVTADGESIALHQDDEGLIGTQWNQMRTWGLLDKEHEALNTGETHYISHNIMATVAAAAEQATDEPLFPTDLPARAGLMVFEYPLILPDLHPVTGETVQDLHMPVRAIAWAQENVWARKTDGDEMEPLEGIFYTLYTDADSFRQLFVPSVARTMPDEYETFKPVYDHFEDDRDVLWCIDTSGWSFGKSWRRAGPTTTARDALPQGEIYDTVATVRRFILALWRFEWQRILVPQTYKPSRHEHKRAHRLGMKLEDGYIKVLRLRRHVEAEARGEHPESDPLAYDHSWLVRGHPRRQWFPSLGPARNPDGSFNVDSHRLIWIEPFVKGNPFAQLVIGHAVTAVVR